AEVILGYFIGPWGMLLTNSIVNSYFNQYLTDVVGFTINKGAWIASFMVLFPVISKLIDAVTNILMGKILDMTACKQGKVRPWLILSIPFVFVSILMMFYMPFSDVKLQAVWVIISFNLYYSVAYTMWNMSKEMTAALSTRNIKQRRTNATAANLVMNMGTGLVSIMFPMILTGIVRGLAGGDNAKGYFMAMGMIACLAVPLTFIQYFFTRERITEERRSHKEIAEEENETAGTEISFKEQLKACLSDKYWVIFMIMVLLVNIATNMRNISLVYYSGWVVNGNHYGEYATIQAKFQMIAMQPMFFGLFLVLPLMKKWGRRKVIWVFSTFTIVGSVIAFMGMGSSLKVYAGSAIGGLGSMALTYLLSTFLGDCIDHVEWKTGKRCDGLSSSFFGAAFMFAVGIAQGIFNLGLMVFGYAQPVQTGVSETGVPLYADQLPSAVNWINCGYQGSFIVIGVVAFFVFLCVFKMEDELPEAEKELQERRVAEYAAKGLEYIPPEELERREIEEQERQAEEIRIKELKERCTKKGLDFDTENQKYLDKKAKKEAKQNKKKK
nr:MFS transporter [Lachnospiraceae bacterium]